MRGSLNGSPVSRADFGANMTAGNKDTGLGEASMGFDLSVSMGQHGEIV